MINTGKELAAACIDLAANYKTLYVNGCFGAPMTAKNKERYTRNTSYNQKTERTVKIMSASTDTFGFDCVCMIKGLLWGWNGDQTKIYGGANYATQNVPDIGEDAMIRLCSGVSTDFTSIAVGEVVWMPGHIGVYIGDGLAVECTPAWEDGVQTTAVHNIGKKAGYNGRNWTKHGKLPYLSYGADEKPVFPATVEKPKFTISVRQLSEGCTGEDVKALQILLIGKGYTCGSWGADGDFGAATKQAVKNYQKDHALDADGIAGIKTMSSLLGV